MRNKRKLKSLLTKLGFTHMKGSNGWNLKEINLTITFTRKDNVVYIVISEPMIRTGFYMDMEWSKIITYLGRIDGFKSIIRDDRLNKLLNH